MGILVYSCIRLGSSLDTSLDTGLEVGQLGRAEAMPISLNHHLGVGVFCDVCRLGEGCPALDQVGRIQPGELLAWSPDDAGHAS